MNAEVFVQRAKTARQDYLKLAEVSREVLRHAYRQSIDFKLEQCIEHIQKSGDLFDIRIKVQRERDVKTLAQSENFDNYPTERVESCLKALLSSHDEWYATVGLLRGEYHGAGYGVDHDAHSITIILPSLK